MQIEHSYLISYTYLLSSAVYFFAVLQMLCRGQVCNFCHIESRGESNIGSLTKM